ncbi:MAG: 4'-phosphopantetheinyl transferase superfamily protein [Planctomycetaceae bacterium]|nr:4'-phosphopantetheinyl transferase superfamily protein [Planctomycetaceae bacterium]
MHLTDPIQILPACRLWLAQIDAADSSSAGNLENDLLEARLSARDLQRWQQYRPQKKKRQFLNSRLAVRAVLRLEFEKDSELIQFDSDQAGRPVLRSLQRGHLPQISISHSAEMVAIALSDGIDPIGVDLEIAQPLRMEALQSIVMHPHEQDWCDAQGDRQSEALLTLWTIKESIWKTLQGDSGLGISDIFLEPDHRTPVAQIRNWEGDVNTFRLRCFVSQCSSFFSETICLKAMNPKSRSQPFRGCVTQRIRNQK